MQRKITRKDFNFTELEEHSKILEKLVVALPRQLYFPQKKENLSEPGNQQLPRLQISIRHINIAVH